MNASQLKHFIAVAAGREKADLVIRGAQIADLGRGLFFPGDIAVCGSRIAGLGEHYQGKEEVDARGLFALPAFIDSHIHIESSMLSPEELGRVAVPLGTGTIIADPHEIVNVCGLNGLHYMEEAAARTSLRVEYMFPSCVPATPFENAGAILNAEDMKEDLADPRVLGLGEMMNFPGLIHCDEGVLQKLLTCQALGKPIDGHSPGLSGQDLCAYAGAGILTDHECSSTEEMEERLRMGMFILLRHGSACHDLERLLPAVTPENSRRCLLCSDDRQAATFLSEGHVNDLLRRCVAFGLDPITAIRMATLNAAEAYGLHDRGALFPGRLADIVLVEDLKDFRARRVYLGGKLAAENGRYLPAIEKAPISAVASSVHLKDFSAERLALQLKSDLVRAIELIPGGVVTGEAHVRVRRDAVNDFVPREDEDLVRISVLERHRLSGNVANGLLKGYGLKRGAVALTIAHDSHNLIVAGRDKEEMAIAARALEQMGGGAVLVLNGQILDALPLPIAGLMSDRSAEEVAKKLAELHELAFEKLGVSRAIEPVMSLCFMSLLVIPSLKLSDLGLFDGTNFSFVPLEVDEKDAE